MIDDSKKKKKKKLKLRWNEAVARKFVHIGGGSS